ncbi:MAG: sodium:proton antiporter [Desulfobacteraceae bacterium]|nr:sodium:proton antiporter [Desulfobacteraceae bacterium]
MEAAFLNHPGLTVAFALVLGMAAQSLAHHLRIPGIVLLLAAGVAFGPDGAGLVHPESLGRSLKILTGFAVAVILFEGGINLKFRRLKRDRRPLRHLILLGGLVTVAGAAAAAHLIMQWPWKRALLFGTLVIVTGPTVINPLLKRLKVRRSVASVLEAEGVLIDAVGAVVATVALEAVLSPADATPLVLTWHVLSRLGFGVIAGGLIGALLLYFFRVRWLIPEGTENVFTLAVVLTLFQGSNLILDESGIVAVTMAGIVTGNFRSSVLHDLVEFKEELTILLVGMLFVLLAADVRLTQVIGLGWPAVGVVLVLMFLVRPAAVLVGTMFSGLDWKERFFISWIGPRGIVAAAVASFFAETLAEKGMAGGHELRALVFLVIAVTVVFAGLTGGSVAGILGLRRPRQEGWVVLGANALALGLAKLFKENGEEVVCIDSNAAHCKAAEDNCTRVIYGNGLQAKFLVRAEIDSRRGALAMTSNDAVNYLFIQKVKEEAKQIPLWAVLKSETAALTTRMLHKSGAELAFAATADVDIWDRRFKDKQVNLQLWQCDTEPSEETSIETLMARFLGTGLIAAAVRRNNSLSPIGDRMQFKKEDEVYFFVFESQEAIVSEFLTREGWRCRVAIDNFTISSCSINQGNG